MAKELKDQKEAAEVAVQQRLEAKLDQVLSEQAQLKAEVADLRDWCKRMARKAGVARIA